MKKKRYGPWRMLSAVLGFMCALALSALFYGTMVYQLGGVPHQDKRENAAPAPLASGQSAQAQFPGPMLALPGELTQENVQDVMIDGVSCRIVKRTYAADGGEATAVSACPAHVLSYLSNEGFVPQLITGFSLAGLDAVCEKKDGRSLLVARDGDCVYMLESQADEQTLYALGAGAQLE